MNAIFEIKLTARGRACVIVAMRRSAAKLLSTVYRRGRETSFRDAGWCEDILSKGRSIPKNVRRQYKTTGTLRQWHYNFEGTNIVNITDKQSLAWFTSDKKMKGLTPKIVATSLRQYWFCSSFFQLFILCWTQKNILPWSGDHWGPLVKTAHRRTFFLVQNLLGLCGSIFKGCNHGLINYVHRHQSKMSSSKKIYL